MILTNITDFSVLKCVKVKFKNINIKVQDQGESMFIEGRMQWFKPSADPKLTHY